ncbi:hypothetical protein ASE95_11965 [Sphingomonas sp. Leaf231]|uniref:hypothetical protein n=1 Tax=Sphingomonas sp. Leaf231 TaxID=1736301 RepID=UPI0006F3B2E8|nr:hypothetical protein [Sphingomonas sp. Leaf231]KQN90979.1 hypothetical protein ASE95_11965 [Sphingomonas sp. Leaf231]
MTPGDAAPPAPDVDPRDAAAATLARATAFLRAQAHQSWLDQPWCDRQRMVRSRVIGNWIGELDRLLHVLLDAAADRAGHPVSTRQRNTANKLVTFCAEASWGMARLDGMARARATFRYTQGAARRADVRGGSHMTVGWSGPGGALRRFRIGERIHLGGNALVEVCDLYDELAAQVVRAPFVQRKGLGHQGI